jgi:hypothetical protein
MLEHTVLLICHFRANVTAPDILRRCFLVPPNRRKCAPARPLVVSDSDQFLYPVLEHRHRNLFSIRLAAGQRFREMGGLFDGDLRR